jgi:hypothetical protein
VSSLPVASTLPSGENAAAQASATWPASASGSFGASSRQIRGVMPEPMTNDRPPGRNAMLLPPPSRSWPGKTCSRRVAARSQTSTGRIPPGTARNERARSDSSGEKTSHYDATLWSGRTCGRTCWRRLDRSTTVTWPEASIMARRDPVGLNTSLTNLAVDSNRSDSRPDSVFQKRIRLFGTTAATHRPSFVRDHGPIGAKFGAVSTRRTSPVHGSCRLIRSPRFTAR